MWKRLEWQPKGEKKPAKAPLRPNPVLVRDFDRGSDPDLLTPNSSLINVSGSLKR